MLHTAGRSKSGASKDPNWIQIGTEIIVHSGGVSSGHYYTFVRSQSSWAIFSFESNLKAEAKARVSGSSLTMRR